jgi:hypothetical protein
VKRSTSATTTRSTARSSINGTLLWVGDAPTQQDLTPAMIRINGVTAGAVTINGSG